MIHDCSSCSLAEVWFEEDGFDVYLNLSRIATKEDIEENHYLEYEGQAIETVKIRLAFCPFCGQKLASDEKLVVPQFQYYNFSGRK